jgi:hypothetical protein
VYPDPRVAEFLAKTFVPVRVHVKNNAEEYKRLGERFSVLWTPTVLIVDPSGTERHRIEGFLPADDFLAQLMLGRAKSAFAQGQFGEAEKAFRAILEQFPGSEAAPEAQYWAGVSAYKATGDAASLGATAKAFDKTYSDSSWAKKASIWKAG